MRSFALELLSWSKKTSNFVWNWRSWNKKQLNCAVWSMPVRRRGSVRLILVRLGDVHVKVFCYLVLIELCSYLLSSVSAQQFVPCHWPRPSSSVSLTFRIFSSPATNSLGFSCSHYFSVILLDVLDMNKVEMFSWVWSTWPLVFVCGPFYSSMPLLVTSSFQLPISFFKCNIFSCASLVYAFDCSLRIRFLVTFQFNVIFDLFIVFFSVERERERRTSAKKSLISLKCLNVYVWTPTVLFSCSFLVIFCWISCVFRNKSRVFWWNIAVPSIIITSSVILASIRSVCPPALIVDRDDFTLALWTCH